MTSLITTADDRMKEANEANSRDLCNESTSIQDDKINVEDNDSEPENVVWSSENPDLDHEIGHKAGHDAHTSGDQGLEETDCLGGNSSCLNIPHSHITIQDDEVAPDEANAADVTANQVEQEARRRNTSLEQLSPPNLHPDTGSTLSIEEQFFQILRSGPTMFRDFAKLKAIREAAEKKIKICDEKISAYEEQLRHENATRKDLDSKLDSLHSNLAIQKGKRKMEQVNKKTTEWKKLELMEPFNTTLNKYAAQVRTTQRHKAASEYTPQ